MRLKLALLPAALLLLAARGESHRDLVALAASAGRAGRSASLDVLPRSRRTGPGAAGWRIPVPPGAIATAARRRR